MRATRLAGNQTSSETVTSYLWLMFTVCFLGNVLAGMTSTLMSVYLPLVAKDLLGSMEDADFNKMSATINALYFTGWAIGGLVWGFISDRIGRARSLAITVSLFGLFTFMNGFALSIEQIFIFQFFCGFGVGGVLVVNTTLLSEVWPSATRAVFIGLLSIGFPVGIFSSGVVNFFVSGWRQGLQVGALSFLLGVASLWILRESEKWRTAQVTPEQKSTKVSQHKNSIVSGIIIFGAMLVGLWAIFSWVPTWIQSIVKGSDGQNERSLSMMLLGIGGLSGGFASGWISNAIGIRRTMLICFAGCFVFSVLLFKGNTEFSILTLLEVALLAFMFGISQGALSVYIPMLFPVAIRAAGTGLCFNVGRFVTAAAVFFVGALVTTLGGYGNSLFAFSFVFPLGFIFLFFSSRNS